MTSALLLGAATPRQRPGLRVAVHWEIVKVLSLRRVQVLLLALVAAPFAATTVLALQASAPSDSLFGRWMHTSGFAAPLVLLGFVGQWVLPLLVAVLAGDVMSMEDQHGTWRTVLTRSMSRPTLVAAKVAVAAGWTVLVVVLLGAASTAAGLLLVGDRAVPGLDGALLGPGAAAGRVALAWASLLPPALAVAGLAVLLSALSRSSAVGIGAPAVLALLSQLVGLLPAAHAVRPLLPTTGFDAWHGLVAGQLHPRLLVVSALVSLAWAAGVLGALVVLVSAREADR